jgi:molybdate transport system substrate-binding protein
LNAKISLWRGSLVIRVALVLLLACLLPPRAAISADLRVFSGGAPQAALRKLAPEFERATGHRVEIVFGLVTEIQRKLATGEQPDLVILPVPLIAQTEKIIPLRSEGRIVLARVGIGVIVPQGTPLRDISSSDAVRKMLLDARALAWSDAGTPTGGHLSRKMAELGIAEEVSRKLIVRAAIQGGAELVAKKEADVGLYLISEVRDASGITMVGLLPAPLQSYVVYGTAIPAYNAAPQTALEFINFISNANRNESWKAAGFELMGAR